MALHVEVRQRLTTPVLLQHHPSRAALLPRTAHLNPLVVEDPEPAARFNPWRTYRACLQVGAGLTEPFVILQDDCIPCTGFLEAAEAVREVVHNGLIAFCLQGMIASTTRSAFWRALEQGQRLLLIRPHNWVPAMALGWTPALAARALEWDTLQTRLRESFTSDDGRLYHFTRWAGVPVWATVPCLVDHPDDVPTVGSEKERNGRKPSRRTLAFIEGDASAVQWGKLATERR